MGVEEVRPPDEMPEESLSFAMLDEKDVKQAVEKSEFEKDLQVFEEKHKVKLEKKTSPAFLLNTIIKHLQDRYVFRFDVVSQMLLFKAAGEKEMKLMQPRDFLNILNEVRMNNIKCSKDMLDDLINSRYVSEEYNPYEDYIYALPKWDGHTDYFEIYLRQVKLEEESQREKFIHDFKKWFVGYVGGLLYEECVNHQCFVLVGGQGTYKTTFQIRLMPEVLRRNYLYSNPFDFDNKDHLKYLGIKGIVLLDELSSFNKTEETKLKTTLTARDVTVRLPYKAYDSQFRRRASFMGNSNEESFLKDETGSRRFNVYKISRIDIDNNMKVDPLYSQALALYKNGFVYWFAGDDIQKIEQANIDFKRVSIEEEMVYTYINKPTDQDRELRVCRRETASQINNWLAKESGGRFNVNESTTKRLAQVMKKLGFYSKMERVQGYAHPVKVWYYERNESGSIRLEDQQEHYEEPFGERQEVYDAPDD